MTQQIRVLLADDEPLFRAGIAQLVDSAPDLQVVAQAHDGSDAIELVRAHRPDVVLLDMQMPVMDGIEALGRILTLAPATRVVILTAFQYDEYLLPALRLGAAGYLLKDSTIEELHGAIRAAARGHSMLSPAVTHRILEVLGGRLDTRREEAQERLSVLTDRERQVLGCLAAGMTNAQIGQRLFMAEATVKTHLSAAMSKIGVSNRTQAAIVAYEAGLNDQYEDG